MREILFRGKRIDNGEWVEGSLLHDTEQNESYIAECFEDKAAYVRQVIPETVGQLVSGITDKNGKKIFEGDVVLWCGIKGIVVWEGHKFVIKGNLLWDFSDDDCIEVIGNIHDNPELIGGKNDGSE